MKRSERYNYVLDYFEKNIPPVETELNYGSPYELLVAVMLSAQCTDKRINAVTPALFAAYPTVESLASATVEEVLPYISSVSYPNSKAKHLVEMAAKVCEDFKGEIPQDFDKLTSLPGVGRKTANLVCGDIYGKPAVVTDTHFIRICGRLGLTDSKNPLVVEKEMRKLLEPDKSNAFCHRTVLFGREVCTARNPHCEECILKDICLKKKG